MVGKCFWTAYVLVLFDVGGCFNYVVHVICHVLAVERIAAGGGA